MSKPNYRHDFAADLVRMKHRAGTLGLFATMQKLEAAVEMVGWEMAGDVLGPARVAKARRKPLTEFQRAQLDRMRSRGP